MTTPTDSNSLTTTTLLGRLRVDRDQLAWREIHDRYRPIVIGFARRLGLSEVDADDAAQETLGQFFADYQAGKYDRERGRLRAWLFGIARNRVADVFRRGAARRADRGDSILMRLSSDDEMTDVWNAEAKQSVMRRALDELARIGKVSKRTLEAFRLNVIEQQPAEEIAAQLQVSVRSVYLAKHRCLKRLQAIVQSVSEAYELD